MDDVPKGRSSRYALFFFALVVFLMPLSRLIDHQVYDASCSLKLIRSEDGTQRAVYHTRYFSDTPQHIRIAEEIGRNERYLPHPLWHYGVLLFSSLTHSSMKISAVAVSIFVNLLWVLALLYVLLDMTGEKELSISTLLFILFAVLYIGPMYLPWMHWPIYLGVGSPNIWHNVTLWTVRPLALVATYFTVKGLKEEKRWALVLAFVAAVLSLFAKPSFMIMFLPALFLYMAIKRYDLVRNGRIYLIALVSASLLVLAYQYTHAFDDGNHIIIKPFGVWMVESENIPLSIVLALAFPMALVLARPSVVHEDRLLLSWIMVGIGIVYFSLFAQSGIYYLHGNFGWSYMIALNLLYLFSVIEYFLIYDTLGRGRRYALLGILILQIAVGLVYFYGISMGENPLYIRM